MVRRRGSTFCGGGQGGGRSGQLLSRFSVATVRTQVWFTVQVHRQDLPVGGLVEGGGLGKAGRGILGRATLTEGRWAAGGGRGRALAGRFGPQ